MKNNYNLFTDFVALAVMSRIEKSISEKKNAEKTQTEKRCKCTENHCKSQQNANKEKPLTTDEELHININKFLEKGIRGDQVIYIPKIEAGKIIEAINKCFEIINSNSDIDFHRIGEYLLDILYILSQYK